MLLIFDAIQAAFVNTLIINIPPGEICSKNLIFNINIIELRAMTIYVRISLLITELKELFMMVKLGCSSAMVVSVHFMNFK